ncbi:MAG TPA: carbohydrate ABC transporter permease, partial [Jatrophihabitantaceae bacterium]
SPYNIIRNVANSLVVALATALLTAVVSTLAGYGLGRFRFRGAGLVFALILVTMMVPFQALLTPLFLELQSMHLVNSLAGLVLFYTTFNLPFGVFMMRNSFKQIPREMEDSARIDGASRTKMLLFVFRPLVVPGIATTVLYAFLFAWTEFLGALTFLTSDNKFTLPVALLGIESGTYGQVNFGYLIAGSVIAMVPCVVLYVALQRYYVQGLMSGAVKG